MLLIVVKEEFVGTTSTVSNVSVVRFLLFDQRLLSVAIEAILVAACIRSLLHLGAVGLALVIKGLLLKDRDDHVLGDKSN